jgi:hypothetical protein
VRRIERVGVVTAWALRIGGTSVRLTGPVWIEGTGMRLTAPLWIGGTGMRLIEVHCGARAPA